LDESASSDPILNSLLTLILAFDTQNLDRPMENPGKAVKAQEFFLAATKRYIKHLCGHDEEASEKCMSSVRQMVHKHIKDFTFIYEDRLSSLNQ
jgi:hypothetical protein